ncbi:Cof-type HAD-IIB family hydrolase [Ectobacillus panaciterrae]|uniref:Cof-type HAD-IIB family hydrolase n=1 Tax=Ectobacillus panaciterrae TaxID=363872 RepID=UPI0004013994|nr:Cof-type HAD-IIB family hydrolase [Ectobacillus panaciterrae]
MKLIAIDMDGTLLSEELEISEQNLAAIRQTQEEGHVVMICSGRAKSDILQFLDRYDLNCPIGASNGSVVYVEGAVLQAAYVPKQTVFTLSDLLEKGAFPYKLYTNKGIFVPRDWKEKVIKAFEGGTSHTHSFTLEEIERITERQLKSNIIQFYDDIEELLADNIEVEKFFILTLHEQKREQLLANMQQQPGIMITASAPTNLEVMHENGHKGNGLRAMAQHFGIPLENTIAMGDNFNDVPMLQTAGFSIAMGNAEEKVKEICDAVTLSNNESGVAHALKTYVLQKTEQR